MKFDLNDKMFRGKENYDDGDFDETVQFNFTQRDTVVSATFEGRRIAYGVLLGMMSVEGRVSGHWMYLNRQHEPALGVFESSIEQAPSGRIVLREHWASLFPGAPKLGFSAIEEI